MNILLWIFQAVVALFAIMGAGWRMVNYEAAAKDVASVGALSQGLWSVIGVFEIVCALCLLLPGALHIKPVLTPLAAALLAIEMLLISALHLKFFGLSFQASNPAMWTIMLSALSAFIAYGRFALRPL